LDSIELTLGDREFLPDASGVYGFEKTETALVGDRGVFGNNFEAYGFESTESALGDRGCCCFLLGHFEACGWESTESTLGDRGCFLGHCGAYEVESTEFALGDRGASRGDLGVYGFECTEIGDRGGLLGPSPKARGGLDAGVPSDSGCPLGSAPAGAYGLSSPQLTALGISSPSPRADLLGAYGASTELALGEEGAYMDSVPCNSVMMCLVLSPGTYGLESTDAASIER